MSEGADRETVLAVERAEIEAWRDTFASAPAHVRSGLGLAERDLDGAFALTAGRIDSLLFNRVIGLGLFGPATGAQLDAALAHFAGAGADFALNLAPEAWTAELESALLARGFATFFHHVRWVRDASPAAPVPGSLTVQRVTPASAGEFATVVAEVVAQGSPVRRDWLAAGVGRPGWTFYLTRDGAEPAGGAALFVHEGVAWLGWGATLPRHRGKGSQSALFAARIEDARAAGCRLLTTETGPNRPGVDATSWRNAQRAGFRVAYERPSWIRP